ncbi:MAG: O-antigen ligase family protein [Microgenomates group bacterium]
MDKIIFFTTLIIFPFGQLFKIGFTNLFDVSVVLLAIITLLQKPKFPNWYKYFIYFVLFCVFSILFNYQFFEFKNVLYLFRLISYSLVAVFISNHINSKDNLFKQLLGGQEIESKLLWLSITAAVFGWIQYLIWLDLTALKYLGWDDHLLRMVGTFLDPTYLALIFILGIILAIKNNKTKALLFLIFSLAFTYSRVSYLILGLIFLFIKFDIKKKILLAIFFSLVVMFLPKNIGEGTTLTRTASGNNKLLNIEETIKIIRTSPLIGVGYNNICSARQKYLSDINTNSHSCNGADSSILFLLATTGVIGLILFVSFLIKMPSSQYLVYSLGAVLIHSVFANSLFYPHVMFWIFALVGSETESDS